MWHWTCRISPEFACYPSGNYQPPKAAQGGRSDCLIRLICRGAAAPGFHSLGNFLRAQSRGSAFEFSCIYDDTQLCMLRAGLSEKSTRRSSVDWFGNPCVL